MLTKILHKIVAQPLVYDAVQEFFGREECHRRMRPFLEATAGSLVLEVGAGTGDWAQVLPPTARYLWYDNDPVKLGGFRVKRLSSLAVLADGANICLKDKSVDYALCVSFSHHLTDQELDDFLRQIAQVCRNKLIFMDGYRYDSSLISNLMWKYDRGSHPRYPDAILAAIQKWFDVDHKAEFSIYHHYLICTGTPKR
jgi:SAM-dependent methyltransferase